MIISETQIFNNKKFNKINNFFRDSFWILLGLLKSGMTRTAKGVLENFVAVVEEFGLVPNGGRTYYLRRSQPPFLIPMVKVYMDYMTEQRLKAPANKAGQKNTTIPTFS